MSALTKRVTMSRDRSMPVCGLCQRLAITRPPLSCLLLPKCSCSDLDIPRLTVPLAAKPSRGVRRSCQPLSEESNAGSWTCAEEIEITQLGRLLLEAYERLQGQAGAFDPETITMRKTRLSQNLVSRGPAEHRGAVRLVGCAGPQPLSRVQVPRGPVPDADFRSMHLLPP